MKIAQFGLEGVLSGAPTSTLSRHIPQWTQEHQLHIPANGDGIEDEALEVLRDFARFLRTLQTVGAK